MRMFLADADKRKSDNYACRHTSRVAAFLPRRTGGYARPVASTVITIRCRPARTAKSPGAPQSTTTSGSRTSLSHLAPPGAEIHLISRRPRPGLRRLSSTDTTKRKLRGHGDVDHVRKVRLGPRTHLSASDLRRLISRFHPNEYHRWSQPLGFESVSDTRLRTYRQDRCTVALPETNGVPGDLNRPGVSGGSIL